MAKRTPVKSAKTAEAEAERPGPRWVPAPTSLDSIIGQERAVDILRGAMGAGRIHHAWIFAGPVGVGKFTAALALGAELLMPRDGDRERVRGLLAAGSHPDLHVVVKELTPFVEDPQVRRQLQTTIPIDVVREFLIAPAQRSRALAGDSPLDRVFIVDEAELLGRESQNALLKTVEEPFAGTAIIFVTSAESELLPTIRSRSQRVAFAPLDEGSFTLWLKRSRLLEGAELSKDDAVFLERFAAGSPGVAAAAVRTGLVEWWRTIGPALKDLDGGRFPFSIGESLAGMADEWAKARVAENKRASKDAAKRAAARWMFRIIGDHYRARLREAVQSGRDQPARGSLRALDLIERAEGQVEWSVQLPFVLESLAAQLAAVGDS